jgi:NTE family protein
MKMATAFVLAGGGSLGAVEVGMLAALVEAGQGPDFLVGASVGALNAAYFATGPTAEGVASLERVWRKLRRPDVFPVDPILGLLALLGRRPGLVQPAMLEMLLRRHVPVERLEDTVLPCYIVATDVLSGEEVLFASGEIVPILLASTAIPAIFPPVRIGDRFLIDGGVSNHTPVSTAVELGASRIVVLPTGYSCAIPRPPRGALAMALQAFNLLVSRQVSTDVERYRDRVRISVVPPLCPLNISAYDFSRTAELIERGCVQTREWLADGGLESSHIPGPMYAHHHPAAEPSHSPAGTSIA